MSVDLQGFDATTVEDNNDFSPIPPGDYEMVISASEEKANKAGNGSYLKLELTVTSGEYANRKLWANLNLNHPNEQTVKIARGELKQICYAVNVLKPNASAELHDIPMIVTVGMEKRKDTGEMQNRLKKYKPKSGGASPGNPAPPASAPKPSAPWAKK